MPSKADLVREAREFLGTPFHHCGRSRLGIDCVGLLSCSFKAVTGHVKDIRSYERTASGEKMLKVIEANGLFRTENPEIGDVLILWITKRCNAEHAAILTDRGIIHATQLEGRVVEHNLNDWWASRIIRAYSTGWASAGSPQASFKPSVAAKAGLVRAKRRRGCKGC